MPLTYALTPTGMVAVASGLALVALGLLALGVRPRRMQVFVFSVFAVAWGVQVVAANMVFRQAPVEAIWPWAVLFVATIAIIPAPLLFFAATYPWTAGRAGRRRALWIGVALGVYAFMAVLLVASAPRLFVAATATTTARFVEGPWLGPLATWSILSFPAALVIMGLKLFRASGTGARDQLALVCAALLAFVSYVASLGVQFVFLSPEAWRLLGAVPLRLFQSVAAFAAAAWFVLGVLRRARLPWRDLILVAGTVPFLAGLAEAVLRGLGTPWIDTVGLWRLAAVGLFVYAIARHRLFDAELRLRWVAGIAAYAVVVLVGVTLVWTALGNPGDAPLLSMLLFAAVAAAAVPVVRLGRALAERVHPALGDAGFLDRRRQAVYQAAREEARAVGRDRTRDRELLAELKLALGIVDPEGAAPGAATYGAPGLPAGATRYAVVRELGRGTEGRALLARDTVLGRHVVLKQPFASLDETVDGERRFLREARVLARIQHPNIVTVYEVIDGDPPALVLEYVEGGGLNNLLDAKGCLGAHEAVRVARSVLAALERVHAEGIVHRDLKPANVFLADDGTAKVGDFGVARAPVSLAGAATIGLVDMQPGTLGFMSPEQARGDPVDARSDLYAVGLLLYVMLTGRMPYELAGRNEMQARAVIQVEPPHIPAEGVPSALEPFLLRALAKDPAKRHADARKALVALDAAARRLPAAPRASRARPGKRRPAAARTPGSTP